MSRTLILGVVIAGIGAAGYYFINQPEPTPGEALKAAAQDAATSVSDAVESATQQASDAVSDAVDSATQQASELTAQVEQATSDLTDQAGDQVAALSDQGQALWNSWVEDGTLAVQDFDYDQLVASVQDSALSDDIKSQAVAILDQIKASPQLVAEKLQELQALLSGQ